MQLKNFTSGAEMIADYKARRERVNNWRPIPQPPTQAFVSTVEPFPIHLFIEPPEPIPVQASMKYITTVHIQKVVCGHYDITPAELCSAQRELRICRARQIAMWLCKKLIANNSLPKIGRDFGKRDHTTVLHAVRKINRLIETDPQLADEIAALKRIIEGAA